MPRARTSHPSASQLASAPFEGFRLPAFRRAVLRWYDLNRRQLPWRQTSDPYRIWVSEIMLQQTRVAAVLEHYRLFLEQFPELSVLAKASESAVLAAWSGLGYYRRARMMRICAQTIVREHKGRFPRTSGELRDLPGIGRYTAAAIASIVFGEPVAVVDGNVERVLERVMGRALSSSETWQWAQQLVTASRPGDHNQAMMELGATICTPRQPSCSACPIRKWCATRGETSRPAESERQTKKQIWCVLDQRDGHIRLLRRGVKASLMAGMWELPQQSVASPGLSPVLRTFRHSITTTDYTVHVARGSAKGQGRWVPVDRLSGLPITGLTRKILRAAGII